MHKGLRMRHCMNRRLLRLVSEALHRVIPSLVAMSAVGCVSVKPYERGYLAKPSMQLTPNPQAASFEQHVFEYREGTAGGFGTMGGGCGCN
jgi:hypothetical protein